MNNSPSTLFFNNLRERLTASYLKLISTKICYEKENNYNHKLLAKDTYYKNLCTTINKYKDYRSILFKLNHFIVYFEKFEHFLVHCNNLVSYADITPKEYTSYNVSTDVLKNLSDTVEEINLLLSLNLLFSVRK